MYFYTMDTHNPDMDLLFFYIGDNIKISTNKFCTNCTNCFNYNLF